MSRIALRARVALRSSLRNVIANAGPLQRFAALHALRVRPARNVRHARRARSPSRARNRNPARSLNPALSPSRAPSLSLARNRRHARSPSRAPRPRLAPPGRSVNERRKSARPSVRPSVTTLAAKLPAFHPVSHELLLWLLDSLSFIWQTFRVSLHRGPPVLLSSPVSSCRLPSSFLVRVVFTDDHSFSSCSSLLFVAQNVCDPIRVMTCWKGLFQARK